MTGHDLGWRAGGLALFVLACATSLTQRSAPSGGSSLDVALGLSGFLLAAAGMLLLVEGARLPRDWRAAFDRRRTGMPAARLAGRRRIGARSARQRQ